MITPTFLFAFQLGDGDITYIDDHGIDAVLQGDKIFMMLASASANYTKPELVTDTFFSWLGVELPEFAYTIKRLEVYADKGNEEEHKFVTLEALGEEVE